MQENVNIVPSFATSFTTYATPDVTVVAGNVIVHVDCTVSAVSTPDNDDVGQLLPRLEDPNVIFTP
jgi:hypothetical protein